METPPTLPQTRQLSKIAFDYGGLSIQPEKTEFFSQRLARRLGQAGVASYDDYIALLQSAKGAAERKRLVEALTTHTTSFFREEGHYKFLLDTGFPELVKKGAGREYSMRIWSAACSTGAELYSAMITVAEYKKAAESVLRVEAIGTDISRPILKRASWAVYDNSEISGLSEERRKQFLLRDKSGAPRFRIVPELRNMCTWSMLNLTETAPSAPSSVSVAFLRNVLIYFDKETQDRVVDTVVNSLSPGGYLMVGHAESLSTPPSTLQKVGPSVYQKVMQ